jgi:hypothetical protein
MQLSNLIIALISFTVMAAAYPPGSTIKNPILGPATPQVIAKAKLAGHDQYGCTWNYLEKTYLDEAINGLCNVDDHAGGHCWIWNFSYDVYVYECNVGPFPS